MMAEISDRAGRPRREFDLAAAIERLFATRTAQFGLMLAVALLTRGSTFGDLYYHSDELLYFLIGQRMHDGLLPYVDIWDRKGPALFAIYYLIAGISRSVLAYQIVACIVAALTAFLANIIAERFSGRVGALLAASLYLIMLPLFSGGGGQAPVFYNLFVALAALITFNGSERRLGGRIGASDYLAMASAGVAIACKQTAALEGAFFGCVIVYQLHRGGLALAPLLRHTIGLIVTGAAPLLAFAGIYAVLGHFPEFWHAMVTSNLRKTYNPSGDAMNRIRALALIGVPLLIPALATFLLGLIGVGRALPRAMLGGWLAAAVIAFVAVPNFIDHYALPLLLPLAVAAAPAFEWRWIGPIFALFMATFALLVGPSLDFAQRRASTAAMAALVTEIRARDPHVRPFVYQGPVYLYALLDSYPPTPLLFPMHLSSEVERDTSHLRTVAEVDRVLAWRPTVVVTFHDVPRTLLDPQTSTLVERYLARCRFWGTRTIIDYYGPQQIDLYGDCQR